MAYQVGKFAGVGERMRALADYAALAGIRQSYLDALKGMYGRLQQAPLEWGDPLYGTKYHDGVVCHAWIGPIMIHYVVYEVDKTVLIIDIKPLFDWPVRP